MRRFLVLTLLVFLAMPVMARADDYEGLVGKLETILTNLTQGYNNLMTGLTDLQQGQIELQTAQNELYQGMNTLYEGMTILRQEQVALSQDVTVLDAQLNNLGKSYADYRNATETIIKDLEFRLKRQTQYLIGGGVLVGSVAIIGLLTGGR